MEYHDLRTWLKRVEQLGELRVIRGAHWNLEIGVLAEFLMRGRNQPVALFDAIKDYPAGYRVLVNDVGSRKRLALTLDLPIDLDERGLMDAWRKARKKIQPIPHKIVQNGPVLENVLKGQEIDLDRFQGALEAISDEDLGEAFDQIPRAWENDNVSRISGHLKSVRDHSAEFVKQVKWRLA